MQLWRWQHSQPTLRQREEEATASLGTVLATFFLLLALFCIPFGGIDEYLASSFVFLNETEVAETTICTAKPPSVLKAGKIGFTTAKKKP